MARRHDRNLKRGNVKNKRIQATFIHGQVVLSRLMNNSRFTSRGRLIIEDEKIKSESREINGIWAMAVLVTPRFRYISLTRLPEPCTPPVNSTVTVWRSDNIVARRRFGSTSSRVSPSLHPPPYSTADVIGIRRVPVEKDKRHVESWRCCALSNPLCKFASQFRCVVLSYLRTRNYELADVGYSISFANFHVSSLITRSISKTKEDSLPEGSILFPSCSSRLRVYTPYDPSRSYSSK